MLRHICGKDRRYVSLDDLTLRDLANDDPTLFLQRYPPPVLIDEIQYAPALLPSIKMNVDTNRLPGAYWLTGSQQDWELWHALRSEEADENAKLEPPAQT